MDADTLNALYQTLLDQPVAALATLHDGDPAVSMTPVAWLPDGRAVIHVSRLATHTADMQAHAKVALLVTAPTTTGATPGASPETSPLALPRLSLQGHAAFVAPDDEGHAAARAAFLARFADAEPMFGFGDFSLVVLTPLAVRFVGGFGRAHAVSAERWQAVCAALSCPASSSTGCA